MTPKPPPYPKPKRLPERKAVTIGVAFRCEDGIVLCADEQISYGGLKYYENKLYRYPLGKNGWVCMTYAGSPDLMKGLRDKFSSRLNGRNFSPNIATIRQALEDSLESMASSFWGEDTLLTLTGVTLGNQEMATFRTYKQTVQEMESFSFVGIGDSSVLRYFTKAFFGPRRKLRLSEATLVAIYMVLQAKVYIEGCGGESDLIVLKPDGSLLPMNLGMIVSKEQEMGKCEYRFQRVLEGITAQSLDESEIQNRSTEFVRALRDAFGNIIF